jgi:hypothetical protein
MEALHLPVPAGRVGRRDDVADLALVQQFAQRAVAAVGHRAVGHQAPGDDAVIGKPRQGALEEGEHGDCFLVVEQLAVDQARVVVDDGVEVVVAERVGALQP